MMEETTYLVSCFVMHIVYIKPEKLSTLGVKKRKRMADFQYFVIPKCHVLWLHQKKTSSEGKNDNKISNLDG